MGISTKKGDPMRVGDIVIVSDLGEMKIYQAKARDLEAEAGLKPNHIKLDLIDTKDYVVSHWKLHELVTDQAGQFKGGAQSEGAFTQGSVGERHGLEEHVEMEVIDMIAKDISDAIATNQPLKWYFGLPETIYHRVMERIDASAKEKLFLTLKKDLVKTDKSHLVEIFQKKAT